MEGHPDPILNSWPREVHPARDCEKISQPPAPFHTTPRGWAGPNLLATILFEKFVQHLPLNRQTERFAKEGVEISLSTLADQVGTCAEALAPIHALIRTHVLAAKRLHGPRHDRAALGQGWSHDSPALDPRLRGGRLYVRDDRPFAGGAPPAALYYFSTDRRKEHPAKHLAGWTGILQADAYGGYNDLYRADHKPAPVLSALCWSHARRKFFELADIKAPLFKNGARKGKKVAEEISPVALEAVNRFDAIFEVERGSEPLGATGPSPMANGLDAQARRNARHDLVRPLMEDLHDWLKAERSRMSKHGPGRQGHQLHVRGN